MHSLPPVAPRGSVLKGLNKYSPRASGREGCDESEILQGLESPPQNGTSVDSAARSKQPSIEQRKVAAAVEGNREGRFFVGSSSEMIQVYNLIRKFAPNNAPVLITGETGTGKELAAAALHERSARAQGPFIPINCAALPASLIASELFGYEKGAFTGAQARKTGLIEAADRGTVFLDEIGHLPIDLQGYLLRFLQEKKIQRVGGLAQTPVDVRIIAATNVDLVSMVEAKEFRADLFYRLNVLSIRIPPLRNRGGDVLTLAEFFVRKFSAEAGKQIRGLTPESCKILAAHTWPGNVRELMSSLQRAVVICDDEWIGVDDLNFPARKTEREQPEIVSGRRPADEIRSLGPDQEKKLLLGALSRHRGNITRAAKSIGISRLTFYRSLEKHGLSDEVSNVRHKSDEAP